MVAATSRASAGNAIACGRWSISRLNAPRAASQPASEGVMGRMRVPRAAAPSSMQQTLSHLISRLSMHDLRRLRAFHAVAERRSFSEAALALGYAQSVVSHHVAALEREFGLTLVDRARRPVGLTEAGERLREHAAVVLGQVAAAEEELRALAGLLTGTVRVAAFLSACTSFVPQALASFEAEHPDVEIQLEQLEPAPALARLRAGELAVAVVWEAPGEPSLSDEGGFERTFLADDPYRIVLPPRHRLARRREVNLADLADDRFIAPPIEVSR